MAHTHRIPLRQAGCSILLLLILLAAPLHAAEPKYPQLTGRVVDDAAILSPSTVSQLTSMLARHEQATGQQVVVVTLPSLQGFSIEEFGYQLGRHWGIGQKDKNTGALLIVAPKERKVRIEVGYGLEGELTDAQSSIIIQRYILPEFRRGDFNSGVLAGTRAVLATLGGHPEAEPAPASGGQPIQFDSSVWTFLLPLIGWLVLLAIIGAMRRRSHIIRRIGRSDYDSGGFFGGSSGGGSGGGFSGGGGSFGGGGASGSW